MNYYEKENDLILIPNSPFFINWGFSALFVIVGISLTFSVIGGLIYINESSSIEFILLSLGSLLLGLILLILTSENTIQEKFTYRSSINMISFSDTAVIFKNLRDCCPEKYIPSSSLESVRIQELIQMKARVGPIPPHSGASFFAPYGIKTNKIVLKLKDGYEEDIWLKNYAKTKQDQKNLQKLIQKYCKNHYPETEILNN